MQHLTDGFHTRTATLTGTTDIPDVLGGFGPLDDGKPYASVGNSATEAKNHLLRMNLKVFLVKRKDLGVPPLERVESSC